MGTTDIFFDAFRDTNPNMDNPSVGAGVIEKNFYVHSMLS